MRYCGECGSSLGVESLYTLRCPNCGAGVETNNSIAGMVDPGLSENPTRAALEHPVTTAPKETAGHLPEQSAPRPRRVLWTIGLIAAALLLLVGGTMLALSHLEKGATTHLTTTGSRISDTGSSSDRTPQGSGSASIVGSGPGGQPATANPGQTGVATQSPIPVGSPAAGATVTVGATPASTITVRPAPTSTPTPAVLSVSPTSFSGLLCVNLGGSAKFTIFNNGGSQLDWNASWTFGYNVSPSAGTLGPGQSQQVSVSSILLSGTVTISASGAENSPEQVHFTCLA
jgi:hypothetical protein